MSFQSLADFLAMGGHGVYVWLCYGTSVLVVLANVLAVRRQRRATLRELAATTRRRSAGRMG